DSAGNPLGDHGILRLQNLDAAGLGNMQVSVFLAQTGNTFDLNDKIEVQYAFDGDIPVNPTDLATGTYTTIGRFVGDTVDQFGDGPLRLDSDLDGLVNGDPEDAGSPALGNTMAEYTFSIPATGSALSVQIRVEQDGGTEELAFDHIRVTGDAVVGTPPTLAAIEGTAISYDEGDPATQVTNTLTVNDPDATRIASATVQISSNFDAAEDVLADNGSVPAGISVGAFNPGTGTLTLTGTATPADYQAALRAVTYRNTDAVNPSVGTRTVRFQAVDGDGNPSNFATRNILIVPNIDPGSVPLVEDFETDGNGERYIASSFNTGALESFFERVTANPDLRHDAGGFTGFTFTPPQGGAYWASEDVANAANALGDHGIIRLRDLDVTGLSGIKVRLHLAETAPNGEGPDDKIEIQFAMDANTGGSDLTAGNYTTIGRFVANSPDEFTSGPMTLDRDLDGVTFGDGPDDAPAATLSQTMQEFEFDIPATGNLLSVQVRVQQNGGSEELAIDHITVVAPLAGPLLVTTDVDEDDGNPGPLSGAGTSLREAIEAANLAPGADVIEFSDGSGGTVDFTAGAAETIAIAGLGQLEVTDDLTINGPGSGRVTIDGGNTVRGMDISNTVTDLDLSGFTIANGNSGAANGGGINLSSTSGTFTFSDVDVRDGAANGTGGGISITDDGSTFTFARLEITGNACTSFGGGINITSNTGSFTFTSSTFEGNSLTGFAGGGGLSFQTGGGSLVIRDSTFHDNTSAGGGAVYATGGATHLINSTLSGNTSGNAGGDVGGGGLLIDGGTTVTVTNTTIIDNVSLSSGGGIRGTATVNNTIVAGNNAPSEPDVTGSFTSNGFNFIGEPGTATGFGADKTFASTGTAIGDVLDPVLKNFGGPTLVHRLVLGSPAIDMGGTPDAVDENLAPLANDQRGPGFPRVQGTSVDIGAYESAPPTVVTTDADSGPGSLREAVGNTPNGGFVTFDPSLDGGTISLTGGDMFVSTGIDIDASSLPRGITISGGGTDRIFFVTSSSPVTLRKLVIADGLEGVGGGIFCNGNLTLEECHVARNTASSLGGGIYQSGGTLAILRSTLSGNTSPNAGGAIRSLGTSNVLTITNSTITGNRAAFGGGIAARLGELNLLHTTISENLGTGGTGGVVAEFGTGTIENSIIAGNKRAGDPRGDFGGSGSSLTILGRNIIGVSAGPYAPLFPPDGVLIGDSNNPVDPHLAPSSLYGGCTPTMQPLAASPAFDNGIASGSTPATDQRGLPRLVGPPDLGAVESGPSITVVNTNDAGGGSLRQAIIDALPNPGTRIYFDSGTFPASIDFGGEISISGQHVFIDASDLPAPVTLNGQSSTRLFLVSANSVVGLAHLGLVKADSGAVSGGAIRTSSSDLSCYRTTFADNLTGDDGAAILLFGGGSVNFHESLVADNTAASLGGGIMSFFGDVTAVNTTFTGNQAGGGAAAWVQGSSKVNLTHVTVTNNTGSQAVTSFGTNTIENTIIAGNSSTNLSGVGTTTFRGNNLLSGNPRLAPLNDFGGPTFSMPPLPGSPVIEGAVLLGTTPCTDQRGLARPNGPLPDTGAAEAHAFSLLPLVDSDNDGIDDRLEPAYPQLTVGVDDSGLDTDADARTDATELGDMTDPLDPTDLFRILSIRTAAGYVPDTNPVFDLTVDTFPGLTYEFEGGNALNNFLPFVPDSTFTADDFVTGAELTLMPGKDFARAKRK
ncbi:MAG: hypothetical protein HKO57_04505, partial [Akkermansiaceae bacterium]|nr:hypothetical protein [Akkermansiaceae bacterium]